MATTGEKNPAQAQTVSEAPWSDNTWENPTNIFNQDAANAAVTAATFDSGDQSYVLKAFDFGVSLPAGSTIDGVIVRVKGAEEQAGEASIGLVQLLTALRAKVGTNKAATEVALTTTPTEYTFGTSTDLWGNSLTEAWVEDVDFGVALGCWARAANTDVVLDAVTIEVFYTPPALADADAEVAWAELEAPTASADAEVAWSEFEVPTASAAAQVAWAELELPTASARADLAWAEMQFSDPDADAEVSWAEVEVPTAPARADVSWAELELPTASARAEVAFAEFEVAYANAAAEVSWAEVEIPEASGPGSSEDHDASATACTSPHPSSDRLTREGTLVPRTLKAYAVPVGSTDAHDAATSTGTGNKLTLARPAWANACMLSAKTNNARVTFGGEDPGAGAAPGLIIVAGAQPVFFPFATDIEFVSEAAANSELNVLWLE